MAVLPKCKLCKVEIDKSEKTSFIKKSNGYYHNDCLNVNEDKKLLKISQDKPATKNETKSEKPKKPCVYCKGGFGSDEDVVKRGSLVFHQGCLSKYQNSDEKVEVKVRLRTCPECKEKVNPLDIDSLDTDTATFHRACYESIQRRKKNREELLDYISLKYNVEFPTGFMLKQITDYHNKRGYSYKAMLATLQYIFDVEKIPTKDGVGLGMIPFYFEKAKSYHKKIKIAGDSANNITINNKAVKIKSVTPRRRTKAGYIDLNSI